MRTAYCLVCRDNYNQEDRSPLLLHCGHSFCRICLSRLLAESPGSSVSCPRCRQVCVVGNDVSALRKNYAILMLLQSREDDKDDDDGDDEDEDEEEEDDDDDIFHDNRYGASTSNGGREYNFNGSRRLDDGFRNGGKIRNNNGKSNSVIGCVYNNNRIMRPNDGFRSERIDLGVHKELKMVELIGEGSSRLGDIQTWAAIVPGRKCKHKVAVKKVVIREGMDVSLIQGQLEELCRKSMWCQNICTFHGVTVLDSSSLCLVMDRCNGSIQTVMQQNGGRLTFEQILRYGADIARGVTELHAAGVVCMNIKPSNLLLGDNGHVVVSDYGLPAILKKPNCQKARKEPESSYIHSCIDCTVLNPNYTAPEAWEPGKRSLHLFREDAVGISWESDSWSFGCTLLEMCTGYIPWGCLNAEEIYQSVVKAKQQPPQYTSFVGAGIPAELWKMIGDCLQFKASKRPSFHSMLALFIRHLQEHLRITPASPDYGLRGNHAMNGEAPSPSADLEVQQARPDFLHRLVYESNIDGVRELLAKTAAECGFSFLRSLLEAQNEEGQTVLHLACVRGNVEVVEAILEYKEANADVLDKDGYPPLVSALAAGSPECVRSLIKGNANVNFNLREEIGPSVAHVCAYHGQADCMQELLWAGADPNAVDDGGESALHRAVAKNHTECAIMILENGGCKSMGILNANDLTPLHLCILTWNVAVVKRWIELASPEEIAVAIDVKSNVGTSLCMAASLKKGHEPEGRELVRTLLAAGADATAQDTKHYQSALHTAAMVKDVELVKIILEAGVDINIRSMKNTIPLHVALAEAAKPCAELLLSAGANCNIQDDDGNNAFHIAAASAKMIHENLELLVVMLRYPNTAVDVRNQSGKTLRDLLEALPRQWIPEDLMEALEEKGVHLSPTIYQFADWVKYRKSIVEPTYGWQGATHKSVGFVQSVTDNDNLMVLFCSGEARVLVKEVIKVLPLDPGQRVKLKSDVKEPRFGWRGQTANSIGTVLCANDDGILHVAFPGASRGWKADPSEMERVEEFKVGDWVRICSTLTTSKHGFGVVTPGSIGVVCFIRPDYSLLLKLSYLDTPWLCEPEEVEHVEPFQIGDRVCVKRSVALPRHGWGGETHHSVGRISEIEDHSLLIIEIPKRSKPWQGDPSNMEKLENFEVGDWVRVKACVPSPKYGWEDITRNNMGIVHSLEEDGDMGIAFCFRSKLFRCSMTDMEKLPPFELGQEIRVMPSITQPRFGWSNETPATVGKIARIDMDGALNVKVTGRYSLWKVSPDDSERLPGFVVGDWVRLKPNLGSRASYDWDRIGKDSIAVVHCVQEAGYLEVTCCSHKGRGMVHHRDSVKVPAYRVGQHVKFRTGLLEPRWGWRGARPDSRGIISSVNANGAVKIAFCGLQGLWRWDPADLTVEETLEVGEWVKLRENSSSWKTIYPGSIGVIKGIGDDDDGDNEWDGSVSVGFCGEHDLWVGNKDNLERVDKFVVGQKVKVKNAVNETKYPWLGRNHSCVGIISSVDGNGKLRIYMLEDSKSWMLDPSDIEIVKERELRVKDWVRVKPSVTCPSHQWGEVSPSSIGVVHSVEDGDACVAFCFLSKLWLCKAEEMELVRPFKAGDKVRIKDGLVRPRWGWGKNTRSSKGEVVGVDANGKLRIKFPRREGKPWVGDPADVVLDNISSDPMD